VVASQCTTGGGVTDQAAIARALALAVAELIAHGGTEAQVEVLREQFKVIAEDEESQPDKQIPD
jgi:hypothetical protein